MNRKIILLGVLLAILGVWFYVEEFTFFINIHDSYYVFRYFDVWLIIVLAILFFSFFIKMVAISRKKPQ